jgi:hypothetical protein
MIRSLPFHLMLAALAAATAFSADLAAQQKAPGPKPAGVNELMADVPAGQLVVVHVPQAARVMGEVDQLLAAVHQEASANPLRKFVNSLALNQPLGAESAVTFCLCPGEAASARPATLVTGIDAAAVVGAGVKDEATGCVLRDKAPAVLVVSDHAVLVGDAAALPAVARAVRGVRLGEAERSTVADADVIVRVDVALLASQREEEYRQTHAALDAKVQTARETQATPRDLALAEQRVLALERLWARAGEVSAVTGGLIVNRRGIDARACLTAKPGSALAKMLGDHPALAGELNPALPSQDFAALGYGSFDAPRLMQLLQWVTGAAVDHAAVFELPASRLGPAEIRDLNTFLAELGDVIGERWGFVVPTRPSTEPVLQLDAMVALKDAAAGAAWRALVPRKLDALTYLVGALWPAANGTKLKTRLDPAPPNLEPKVDMWRLTPEFPAPAEGEAPSSAQRMADALLGSRGLSLWNLAAGSWGVVSVAPGTSRVAAMLEGATRPKLGQAGDDPRTVEAVRHALPRSNLIVVFSPSVVSQLVSRTILSGLGAYGKAEDVPLVPPAELATLSVRLSGETLTARLYVPMTELEPVFTMRRTLEMLEGIPAAPKLTPP